MDVFIQSEFIKLDSLLKLAGIAQTGGFAKMIIGESMVEVNGEICQMRGKKIKPGDDVTVTLYNDDDEIDEVITIHVKAEV